MGAVAWTPLRTLLHPAILLFAFAVMLVAAAEAPAQCPANPPLPNHSGTPATPCQCFIPNEQAGATFNPPLSDYPLEVLSVSIWWGSPTGGASSQTEMGIHFYNGALPNPGAPVHTIAGPTLVDNGIMGGFNTFTIPPLAVSSGPITVTLEYLNNSNTSQFSPDIVWDNDGCQAGRNVVFTGGQWFDACVLGVAGDWVMELTYRPCTSSVPVEERSWGAVKAVFATETGTR